MKEIVLRNWTVVKVNGEVSLAGYVYNDPRNDGNKFADGHRIITSEVIEIDRQTNTGLTRNTLYNLEDELPLGGGIMEISTPEGKEWFERILPKII